MAVSVGVRTHKRREHVDLKKSLVSSQIKLFDKRANAHAIRLLPGAFYVTDAVDEMIVTVLGSCISACIRNPHNGYGGMNHFMLPESDSGDWNGVSAALRYGNYAMEALINDVLRSGCARHDLEIKLFGGANFTIGPAMVGEKNAQFVLRYLETDGLRVAAHDLGGQSGRRIHYFPATGKVERMLLKPAGEIKLAAQEQRYGATLRNAPIEGDVDLFD